MAEESNMTDTMINGLSKTLTTMAVWASVSWILTGINPSGGTVGWALFFALLATCAIWSDGNMSIF